MSTINIATDTTDRPLELPESGELANHWNDYLDGALNNINDLLNKLKDNAQEVNIENLSDGEMGLYSSKLRARLLDEVNRYLVTNTNNKISPIPDDFNLLNLSESQQEEMIQQNLPCSIHRHEGSINPRTNLYRPLKAKNPEDSSFPSNVLSILDDAVPYYLLHYMLGNGENISVTGLLNELNAPDGIKKQIVPILNYLNRERAYLTGDKTLKFDVKSPFFDVLKTGTQEIDYKRNTPYDESLESAKKDWAIPYKLAEERYYKPIATKGSLGIVRVGRKLKIDAGGVLSLMTAEDVKWTPLVNIVEVSKGSVLAMFDVLDTYEGLISEIRYQVFYSDSIGVTPDNARWKSIVSADSQIAISGLLSSITYYFVVAATCAEAQHPFISEETSFLSGETFESGIFDKLFSGIVVNSDKVKKTISFGINNIQKIKAVLSNEYSFRISSISFSKNKDMSTLYPELSNTLVYDDSTTVQTKYTTANDSFFYFMKVAVKRINDGQERLFDTHLEIVTTPNDGPTLVEGVYSKAASDGTFAYTYWLPVEGAHYQIVWRKIGTTITGPLTLSDSSSAYFNAGAAYVGNAFLDKDSYYLFGIRKEGDTTITDSSLHTPSVGSITFSKSGTFIFSPPATALGPFYLSAYGAGGQGSGASSFKTEVYESNILKATHTEIFCGNGGGSGGLSKTTFHTFGKDVLIAKVGKGGIKTNKANEFDLLSLTETNETKKYIYYLRNSLDGADGTGSSIRTQDGTILCLSNGGQGGDCVFGEYGVKRPSLPPVSTNGGTTIGASDIKDTGTKAGANGFLATGDVTKYGTGGSQLREYDNSISTSDTIHTNIPGPGGRILGSPSVFCDGGAGATLLTDNGDFGKDGQITITWDC